ncbi:hypothetical protein RQP46_002328 [Phenoliferia psychrophenolica]
MERKIVPEVFQASLSVERPQSRDVIKALLGTILFQRLLGNVKPRSVEVCGVTFPVPSDVEIDTLISTKVDAFSRALDYSPKSTRLVVSFFPTPATPPSPRLKSRPAPLSTPATMTSAALGWFHASTKALVVGAHGDDRDNDDDQGERDHHGAIWEAWVIDVEILNEGRRGVAEEKLRSQLNDFLLRTIMFVTDKTAHVPPITNADQIPFGVQILINPSSLSFTIPKAVVHAPVAFPLLHRSLVNPKRDESPRPSESERYAAGSYGR